MTRLEPLTCFGFDDDDTMMDATQLLELIGEPDNLEPNEIVLGLWESDDKACELPPLDEVSRILSTCTSTATDTSADGVRGHILSNLKAWGDLALRCRPHATRTASRAP